MGTTARWFRSSVESHGFPVVSLRLSCQTCCCRASRHSLVILAKCTSLCSLAAVILPLPVLPRAPLGPYLPQQAGHEVRAQVSHSLGLDQPVLIQHGRFVLNMMQDDFGSSMWWA